MKEDPKELKSEGSEEQEKKNVLGVCFEHITNGVYVEIRTPVHTIHLKLMDGIGRAYYSIFDNKSNQGVISGDAPRADIFQRIHKFTRYPGSTPTVAGTGTTPYKDLDPEFQEIVNKNFDKLLGSDNAHSHTEGSEETSKDKFEVFYNGEWNVVSENHYLGFTNNGYHGRVNGVQETTEYSTPEKPNNSKPDFEVMARVHADKKYGIKYLSHTHHMKWVDCKANFKAGMEKLYSDIYLPKVREMQKETEKLNDLNRTTISKQGDTIQELRDKLKALEEENVRLLHAVKTMTKGLE